MSAVGFAFLLTTPTALTSCDQHPMVGCATALDSLLGPACGAKQWGAYGQWAKIGVLSLVGLSVPLAGMLFLSEAILVGMGQDAALAEKAGVKGITVHSVKEL